MIDIYTGTPGSGKSLNAVKKVMTRLLMRRRVLLNFEVTIPKTLQKRMREPIIWDNSMILIENFVDFAQRRHKKNRKGRVYEHQTLVVIDECQLLFDKDMLTPESRKQWKWFFTQHRKMGYDFLLITQHIDCVDATIRKLLERETMHFKLENNPSTKMWMLLMWTIFKLLGITLFISVTRWIKFDIKMFRKTSFFTYQKWLEDVYNTSNMFDSNDAFDPPPVSRRRQKAGGAPLGENRPVAALETHDAETYAQELINVRLADYMETTTWGVKLKASQADETE